MNRRQQPAHFPDIRSLDTDSKIEECVNNAYPLRMLMPVVDSVATNDEEESVIEPYVGLAFHTSDDAREFYTLYAARMGFNVRIGQLYRSRTDGSVSARRFVCSKEGFQTSTRTGCGALIRVQRRDSGKWVIDLFLKNHNHELGPTEGNHSLILQQKILTAIPVEVVRRSKSNLFEEVEDRLACSSGVITAKRLKSTGDQMQSDVEPSSGLEFNSANEAYQYYHAYAERTGYRIRIGQLFRSKNDGSITSRRFVCSREGFQHPSRVGCGAFMRIKRLESGRWVVDRLEKHHNHNLESQEEVQKKNITTSKKFIEDENDGLDIEDIVDINNGNLVKKRRENHIGSDWYSVLLNYFRTKQADDTGFFYAVEVDHGTCMSIFWADGRSRFSCSQFGDAIAFDTSYRKGMYVIPFATFIGINHNRQPVLLGCALLADESEKTFTWLFQTWLLAMSGRHPRSIVADQDDIIQQAIIHVFPGTHHRFSMWQIKAKECEHLSSVHSSFQSEYEKCINQSQTTDEFDTAWNSLLCRYGLKDNTWLKAMYEKRQCWVPLYLRATFFAGIPLNGSIEPFFGSRVNAQTPLMEFVLRYENGLEQRREEELKENFNCSILNAYLQTKEPVEDQCRRLYTLTIFRIFQKELLQSFSYLGFKTYEEVDIIRYLVRKCGNGDDDRSTVTISKSIHNVCCSCQMFEFEGVLCRHVLRVFQMLEIKEIPSRYILCRWRKNAEYGLPPYSESGGSPQEINASMLWSLREEACKYIEVGATSLEKHRVAYEILHEEFCPQERGKERRTRKICIVNNPTGEVLYPGLSKGENQLRWGFIRKVYGIVAAQLLLTTAVSAVTVFYSPINGVLKSTPSLLFFFAILPILLLWPLCIYQQRHPLNFVFLGIFTLSLSVTVGVTVADTDGEIVLEALILTSGVVASLTAYTFWASKRGKNFSFFGPVLFTGLTVLLLTSFMQIFCPLGPTSDAVVGATGAVLFSGYIVYDTENLIMMSTSGPPSLFISIF